MVDVIADTSGLDPSRRRLGAVERLELLRHALLFSEFPPDTLASAEGRFVERTYARGDVVWNAGDEGHELLVVVSGELAVWGPGSESSKQQVGTIARGECAGEMAVVLDERRSATVTCSRAALVLALAKDDFRDMIRDDSRVMTGLVELLSRRAMSLVRNGPVTTAPIVVGVVADVGVPGASLVAGAVSELAEEVLGFEALLIRVGATGTSPASIGEGSVLVDSLRARRGLPTLLELACPDGPDADELAKAVDDVLQAFGRRFRLIVLDFAAPAAIGMPAAGEACGLVVHVTGGGAPAPDCRARVLQVVNRFCGNATPMPLNHCEPFVLPSEPVFMARSSSDDPLPLGDPNLPLSRVLRRLTRKLAGVTVGIALGGGAAFGIAHVGVLVALEEAGLPVDLVAGTSMGSIVALGYAAGLRPTEMRDIAGRIGNVRTALSAIDPSLSGAGFLSGRRLISIFSPLLDREGFSELDVPCRVVAMDIDTGTAVQIASGRLDEAFRASCSIPIIFTPVSRDGRTLVDGGMIDPVPAGVLRDMGADIVIAVNVVPRLDPEVSTSLSRTFKRVNRFNPLSFFSGSRDMPDLVDIFMNSLQALQHELGNFKSLDADVLVNVDLGEFTWIDFHRAVDIVECGRRAGEQAAPGVRAALDARLGAGE